MEQKTTFHTDTCCFIHAEAHEFGIAKGTAECILDTLSDYGKIPLGLQEKILRQKNFSQLKRWFLLARQVHTVEEFANRM
mgnify:CR=1 FL=1